MTKIKTSWFLFGRQSDIPEEFSVSTNFRFCRFYYVLDGECVYKDSKETITLEKGYIYLLPQKSYSLHYGENKNFLHVWGHFQMEGWQFNNVMKFDPGANPVCVRFLDLIDAFSEKYFIEPRLEKPSHMTNLFSDNKQFPIVENIFSALTNYLFVNFIGAEEAEQPFDAVLTYINNNLAADLSNQALAKITQYSRAHFIQEFTKRYRTPPQKYVVKVRISQAIILLMNDEKLYNISYKVGYDNPKSFARAFKRETGLSPQEYKNLHYYSIHKKEY